MKKTKKKTRKKTSANSATNVVAAGKMRYRLEAAVMKPIPRWRGDRYRYFATRGDVQTMLYELYQGKSPDTTLPTWSIWSGTRFLAICFISDDKLRIGCHKFGKAAVRKLARWAGVDVG